MKILVNEKISQHKYKTPEGYLICVDSVLARTGSQTYRKNELFLDGDDSEIEVGRNPEEVFAPETLASFENKPITVEHPHEDVNVENYKDYAVGFVRDVKKGKFDGQDVILGTLVITDKDAIEGIENGEHVELSCGYDCDIEDGDDGYQQKHIRGNHVALCEAGRAGVAKIVDSVEDEDIVKYKGYTLKFHKGYNMWMNMRDYYEVFDERGNKVAMKKDLKSAKEYVDNGGFKDSIEDDYNYDVETNFDKILYDLTANNIDYSSAAYDTQLIWFKDDTEYEKAKKYLDRKRWKYKEGVNKKGVKYFEIKDAVKDKDYGGAFDLKPESYFSRDDLIDFEDELERKLGHKARTRAYVDGTTLSVDYELDGESYSTPAEVKIDMRKIKRPQDLIKHYLEPIRKIIEKEYKDWTSDSMKDAVEPEAKGQYKGYTIIAKSTGRANAPTLLEIYDGNKKVKSFFSADEDLDDAIHDVPKYWPLPPLPQKKYDMLSSYLNMISTFTSRDIDIKDVLRPLSGKGFKYTIDKIEGWIWKKGEMAYKNYYVSLDEYTNKFIVTLYADPNQDWKVNEVSAYINDSIKDKKDEWLSNEAKTLKRELGFYKTPGKSGHGGGKSPNTYPFNQQITERMNDILEEIAKGNVSEKVFTTFDTLIDGYKESFDMLEPKAQQNMKRALTRAKNIRERILQHLNSQNIQDETPYEEQTEKLEEDVATFDDKFSTAKKEIITWWKEVERWNEKAGRPFNIDNGNYDNAYDLWSAMYDMFTESKLKAERPDLAKQGQRIYKKWEYDFNWTFNDSVHDVEPRSGESKDEFISRFMEETKSEYPDEKQRVAVAYSYWEKAHGKDSIKDAKELSAKSIDNLDEMMNHYKRKHPQAEFGEIEKRKDYYVVKVLRDSKLNDDYSTRAPGGKIKALFETESGKKYAVVERRDDIAILGGYDTNTGHWDTIMSGFTNLGSAKQAVEGYMRKWGDRPARNKVEIKGIDEIEGLTDKMLPLADKMVKLRQEYEAMRKQYHQLSKKQDQIDDQNERNKFFEKNMHGLYDKWMKKSDELLEVRKQYGKLHDKFYLIGGRINRSNDVDALKLMNELEAKVKKANEVYYYITSNRYYQDPELGDSMKDSIYSLNIVGQKSRKLVRAKDAREAIDKYNKMFPKDKIKSVKKTDKFNNIIETITR